MGKVEKDNQERKRLFNSAIAAIKMVEGYTKEPAELKELDLKKGEILVRKMLAEKALGLNDQAVETRGHAIVAFSGIVVRRQCSLIIISIVVLILETFEKTMS
jgi:hypothetical protein